MTKAKSIFTKPIYVGAATRSPIGKFGGSFKKYSAPQLASFVLKEALQRAPESKAPEWVFLGHARQAGAGPNPARQAAHSAGVSQSVPAFTVNQACASGMTALFSGIEKIALGQASSVWAGGVESMSNTPYLLMDARWGQRLGHSQILDGMSKDGFFCPLAQMLMGETVERFLAQEKGITRASQDEYALKSQQKADAAWKSGHFLKETFPIDGFQEDEHRRGDTTKESLAKLPPVFDSKTGTLTAGNSSGITDGAAFLHLSSEKLSHAQAEILDYQTVALDPKYMGLGPVEAIGQILKRQNLQIKDLDVIEINEAFAAQVIACQRELNIPDEKLNPNGGSIAIGHPIGASGARVTVTLLHQLNGKPGALGIASLCVSGGLGVALLVKGL